MNSNSSKFYQILVNRLLMLNIRMQHNAACSWRGVVTSQLRVSSINV